MPADGFYEWQKIADKKQPYYIRLKDQELYGMAGLWETWRSPTGEELHSYSIVTTAANTLMEPIHNRMPVILEKQYEEPWLDPDLQDTQILHSFLKSYNPELMEAFAVSSEVNNVRNNLDTLIRPLNSQ